MKEVIQNLVVR